MRYLGLNGVGSGHSFCHVQYVCRGGFVTLATIKGTRECTRKRSEEEKNGRYVWIKTLIYRNKGSFKRLSVCCGG